MTNVYTTFVICPLCNRWVTLEGHEHAAEIERLQQFNRRARRTLAILPGTMTRLPCVLVPVKKQPPPTAGE